MNKNILILSVLLALNSTAFADAGDQAAASVEKPEVTAEKPVAVPPQPASQPAKKENTSVIKVEGRVVEKNEDGTLFVYFCNVGLDCHKQVLATKELTDTVAISKEILAKAEESKKVDSTKKEETSKKVVVEEKKLNTKEYTRDLLADLEDSILDSCDIETKSSRVRDRDDDRDTDRPSWSRVRNRTRSETTRSSILTSGRFTHAQSEESSESTECAAEALQSKLEELEKSFDDDLAELGLRDEDLENLNEIAKNLNNEIRKEKDPEKKATLELALSKVKALSDKVKLTQNITQRFVRTQVLNRFENDLASRAGYGETYLHRIAAGTPDLFEGVRKDAAVSILEVYKKQVRSYIALRDAGNLQESNRIGNLATGYNIFMTGRQEDGKSAGQKLMEQYALDANLNPRTVVNDIYKVYSPAEADIRSYLATSAAGGAQNKALPLPGVLATTPMMGTEAGIQNVNGLQPSRHTIGRANRSGQVVNPQQGRASVPAPNGGPPRGGVRQGL